MRQKETKTILDAKAAAGIGTTISLKGYGKATISVDTEDNATLTIMVAGSIQESVPDFSAAQSPSNQFSYLNLTDLEDKGAKSGDTGIAFSGTDGHLMYNVDFSVLNWICVIVSAYTSGKVTVKIAPAND